MALRLKRLDHVEREQHDGAVGPAVKAPVALPVAVDAVCRHECFEHRLLRDAAARSVDRLDPSARLVHCRDRTLCPLRGVSLATGPAVTGTISSFAAAHE